MTDLIDPQGPMALYDQGLPRLTPAKGYCERCQARRVEVAGRFCTDCYNFLEVRHQYERDHRAYLNNFCKNVETAAKEKYGRERLAPPANPIKTVEVVARPVVEIRALPAGGDDGEA